jgi:H+-transporting ATPase
MAPCGPPRREKPTRICKLLKFVPFDPATKMSEATATDSGGSTVRAVKGAFAAVAGLTQPDTEASKTANALEAQGFRVLAVALGPPRALKLAGLIALSDPPRPDSAALITELHALGVRAVMVTGDAPATAAIVAHAVGLDGKVCPPGPIPADVRPQDFAVFAGILPEGKYDLVKALQKSGYIVGMCGDGANDAPALRQAQMGIAVSTATDVAKSAAGIVLTKPGTRRYRRFDKRRPRNVPAHPTYTLNSVTKKVVQVLFLAVGLVMTGHAMLTPMPIVIIMLTGDLLGNVPDDRQRAPVSDSQCLANQPIDDRRSFHGNLRAGLLHRRPRVRQISSGSRNGSAANSSLRDHRIRQSGNHLYQS